MAIGRVYPALEPSLENGDRLLQSEFHRRYELHHVELVEGVVYMPPPIRITNHAEPRALIIAWLGSYAARHPGVRFAGPGTVMLDGENEPEPDAMMFFDSGSGGQARVGDTGYVVGAPDLVVEISASSNSIDLGDKFRAYQRNGVREYIVWSTLENRLRWFALRNGAFEPLTADTEGVMHSIVFEGLRLNVERLLNGDLAAVLATQMTG